LFFWACCARTASSRGATARLVYSSILIHCTLTSTTMLHSFNALCFSGSRSFVPQGFEGLLASVSPSASIYVGCAGGVDASVRLFFGSRCTVFHASEFGKGRASFVRRSVACVSACAAHSGVRGFVVAPAMPAPPSFALPSAKKWVSCGSGSWSSLGIAFSLGLQCFVVAPALSWLPLAPLTLVWKEVEKNLFRLQH
jgi:hypothetical protein